MKNADPLKTMACTRRGYFSHIASPADVKENVMQYYHVMNRQLAKTSSTAAQPRWSQESFLIQHHLSDIQTMIVTKKVSKMLGNLSIRFIMKAELVVN